MHNDKKSLVVLITTYQRNDKLLRLLFLINKVKWIDNALRINVFVYDDDPNNDFRIPKELNNNVVNFTYIKRKINLGQGPNLSSAIQELSKSYSNNFLWCPADDDLIDIFHFPIFINNLLNSKASVGVCGFKQGISKIVTTDFNGTDRVIYDYDLCIDAIRKRGKGSNVIFKIPDSYDINRIIKDYSGCYYEDKIFALNSIFNCNDSEYRCVYLYPKVITFADQEYGKLRYSMRVYLNRDMAMNKEIKYHISLGHKIKLIDTSNNNSELYWYFMGLLISIKPRSEVRYTRKRFFNELRLFLSVLKRSLFGKDIDYLS